MCCNKRCNSQIKRNTNIRQHKAQGAKLCIALLFYHLLHYHNYPPYKYYLMKS